MRFYERLIADATQECLHVHDYPIPPFSDEALAQAHKAVTEEDPVPDRVKLDDIPLACVDPHDASERDDAVAAVANPAGGWTLHVAVADVASYVEAHSPLDVEAGRLAAACHLPDRTLTMLPAALVATASLTPGKTNRVLWTRLEVEPHGAVRASRVMVPAVAEDVTVFDVNDTNLHEALTELLACARAMHKHRITTRRPPVVFPDRGEPVFERDRQGAPTHWTMRRQSTAGKAVEEAMIAANRAAAKWLFEAGAGAATIARAQSAPSPGDWRGLREYLGVDSTSERTMLRFDVRALMQRGEHEALAVSRILPPARYVRLDGDTAHFALSEEQYVHSTSPLRRYPDLTVQRTAHTVHRGEPLPVLGEERIETINANAARTAKVERDVVKRWLTAAFERRRVVVEQGTVTGIADFGAFVRLDGYEPLEGLVHISWLNGDVWAYARTPWSIAGWIGEHEVTWRLGDTVAVEVDECDAYAGRIGLKPVGAVKRSREYRSEYRLDDDEEDEEELYERLRD